MMKVYKIVLIILLVSVATSCKKFVQIGVPKDQVVAAQVFQNEDLAKAAVVGIYAKLATGSNTFASGSASVALLAGRSADDFAIQPTDGLVSYSINTIPSWGSTTKFMWQSLYECIYAANAVIEGVGQSTRISKATSSQLLGEARFIRAFCNFYLVNLYGPIPLTTTTDYRVNNVAERSSIKDVYTQIITDLVAAKEEVQVNYPTSERVRANRFAVTAFLARVYLYQGEWEKAEKEASEVIANKTVYDLMDVDQAFIKNGKDAIWQLMQYPGSLVNTAEGNLFILIAEPTSGQVILSADLVAAFEPEDLRRKKWVGTFSTSKGSWNFPYKYKVKTTGTNPVSEHSMVLSVAEQYLIRAEARIHQAGKKELGIADLNEIRKRARPAGTQEIPNPLPDYELTMSEPNALLAVEKERRLELFSEWGHRWLDLKRTLRADAVLGPIKGVNWKSTAVLYPIPDTERLNNPKLWQNDGYDN